MNGDMTDTPIPRPTDQPEDHERQTTIRQIQQAMADGHIDFEEIDDRFALVFEAQTRAELAATVADLPAPPAPGPPPVAHPLPRSSFSLFGDVEVGGWVGVDGDLTYGAIFGDIIVDLSSAALPDEVTITTFSLFGDTVVIVPDGVRASMESFLLFGDRRSALSPARPGAPTVVAKCFKLFGDAKLYSLSLVPEGRFRQFWRQLRAKN